MSKSISSEAVEALKQRIDSLEFELAGIERARVKDNEYLIGQRDALAGAVKEVMISAIDDPNPHSSAKLIPRGAWEACWHRLADYEEATKV